MRITLKRIRYAMQGSKSEGVYRELRGEEILLTDKQLKNRTLYLRSKKFISRFTYKKRETWYSTRIKTVEKLSEKVANYKAYRKGLKAGLIDELGTQVVENRLKEKEDEIKFIKQRGAGDIKTRLEKVKLEDLMRASG